MKRAEFLVLTLLFLYVSMISAYPQFRPDTGYRSVKISLLTYSPGNKLYSVFGHSAIRIYDGGNLTDDVYNYGTFNFDQPGFYFRFLQGNLIYSLSCVPFEYVKQSLILENRSLTETPLNLTNSDKSQITAFLKNNLLPENRDYRYDFLYDNCATRIIGLYNTCISDSLVLKPEVLPVRSFRRLISPYLKNRPWVHMGVDLLMGTPADKVARLYQPAFLPDYLHLFTKNFQVETVTSRYKLARHDIVHFQNYPEPEKPKLTPSLILWPVFILLLLSMLIDSYFKPLFRRIGNLILLLTGLVSVLLCYLWIFSDHNIFRYNTDILWANPLLLPVAFFKNSPQHDWQIIVNKIVLWLTGILVASGTLVSLMVERNLYLFALGIIVLIIILEKYRSTVNTFRKNSIS